MEFELPKINVSFEYDEEKDEIVFVINGVEKRVKNADMITEMEKLQEQNTALEQQPCDCISRQAVNALIDELARAISDERCCISRGRDTATIMQEILDLPSVLPKQKTESKIHCNCTDAEIAKSFIEDVETVKELLPRAESEDKE